MRNKRIWLILIFTSALVLRLLFLNKIPFGVTNDEASVAYDAWLLSKTGKDQWGEFLPLEFRGFGDYRLPVYQYLLVPLVRLFGLKAWAIRLPTAFFASASIILLFFLIRLIFKDQKIKGDTIGLISAFLLIINPWHFGLSRVIMESNLGLFFVLLSVYFYLKSEKDLRQFSLGVFFAILSFYTYYSYRIFLPLFLLILTLNNQNLIKKQWKKKLKVVLIGLIFLIPIIISVFQGGGTARLSQVSIFRDKSIAGQINEYQGACKEKLPSFVCRIFFNKHSAYFKQFALNYFNHFSPQFLFFSEFEKGWGFLPPSSYFYLINLPFFFAGLFYLLKKPEGKPFFTFLLLAPLADSLTGKGHFARSFLMTVPVVFFIAGGWYCFFSFLKKRKKAYLVILPILVYFYSFSQFLINYFFYFPVKHARCTYYEYQPLFEYLKKAEADYDQIYISKINRDTKQYIFYLYYFQIEPEKYFGFERQIEIEDGGWVWIKKMGKFYFIDQPDRLANYPQKSLLAIDPQGVGGFGKPMETIKYPDGKVAFNIYDLDKAREEQASLKK